jgi:hypothetical protein
MKSNKTLIAITACAIALAGTRPAQAGDREWAVAGKVLTGVVAGSLLVRALDCDRAPAQTVVYAPAPVVYAPAPVVYAPAPVVSAPAPPPVVYVQPVYVAPAPYGYIHRPVVHRHYPVVVSYPPMVAGYRHHR